MTDAAESGMVHLRLIAGAGEAPHVLRVLEDSPAVASLVRIAGSSVRPPGDLILCDVAREEVSVLVSQLRRSGLGRGGSISIDAVDSVISADARRAALASAGSSADAVIWEDVEARTSESADFSFSFAAFMVLATLIAAIGILTGSQILIIGAMVVGPEFGPLAALCVALVQRRAALAARSAAALAAGFPLGIAVAFALVLILRVAGPAPDALTVQGRAVTFFISHPDVYSVLVALLAGVAGLLSLTTAKSGALLGVLISVTTIPAAANVGVAAAYADWHQARGALTQLALNMACIATAGTITLAAQRLAFRRRLRRARARALPVDVPIGPARGNAQRFFGRGGPLHPLHHRQLPVEKGSVRYLVTITTSGLAPGSITSKRLTLAMLQHGKSQTFLRNDRGLPAC